MIRPIEPEDAALLERLFYRLSPETVYRRFFQTVTKPDPKMCQWLATVDHGKREALVAVDENGEIMGVARYDRTPGTDEAEVAVLVEDAWQHHGIGSELMRELGQLASSRGVTAFTAVMLGDNRPVVRFVRATSPNDPKIVFDSGELVARIPLRVEPAA